MNDDLRTYYAYKETIRKANSRFKNNHGVHRPMTGIQVFFILYVIIGVTMCIIW